MDIYTIGHSNYSVETLVNMLRLYDITCVVDIRGTPYSKYNVQFNKETISDTLKKLGFLYIYMGKEFAAQREDRSSYTSEGYADFNKAMADENFKRGIERVKLGYEKGYRIALLGARQDPINCHRAILVGRALRREGIEMHHILHEKTLATQEELEKNLIDKYFKDDGQLTMDILLGTSPSKEELLQKAYDASNREIGFKVERLKK